MTSGEAGGHAFRLFRKWVSSEGDSIYAASEEGLARTHASMLQEHRWNAKNPARCSAGCAAETRGDLVMLGKVKKALQKSILKAAA